jgi:uncharacterized membrane protein YbaN (DUF454 family)
MKKYNHLRGEIRQFRKERAWWGIPLIFLGLVGLVFPILPGWVFIIFGTLLMFPKSENRIRKTYDELGGKVRKHFSWLF